ncbi:metalloregulator ArsR/SmtB family transcription factor [Pseudoxanthobacter sp.]|uniref:ArsR/SmtB family transcription factor n=1 Tax=Pseudoxanthobacter sp. TaxID=1925742 RepID=UPI002FE0B01A
MKISSQLLSDKADEAAELLRALANPHRLLILCRLAGGEWPVGELAAALGFRDAAVSRHLARLRHDGLVAGRREGQTIHYRLTSAATAAILIALQSSFCPELACDADPSRLSAEGLHDEHPGV